MIEKLISYTKKNDQMNSIIDFSKLQQLDFKKFNYEKYIEKRKSSRNFNNNSEVSLYEVHQLFDFIENIKNELLLNPDVLSLCFLDSQCTINQERGIYIYQNGQFISLEIREKIINNSLFLQEELNKGTGVLLFLWENNFVNTVMREKAFQYRELLTISGTLGYLASIFGFLKDYKGTVFAGAIQKEWDRIVVTTEYRPIFAYAFEQ